LGWRIGDERKVSIWKDAWVPGNDDFKVQNMDANSSLSTVADLIDANTRK